MELFYCEFFKKTRLNWHPSYDHRNTLQSFGEKLLRMGNVLKKCKSFLKDAKFLGVSHFLHKFKNQRVASQIGPEFILFTGKKSVSCLNFMVNIV